jgi:putative ABC transport system permease protein
MIIMLQNNYLKTADLGFNKEAVLMVPVPKPDKSNMNYLRNQLLKEPGIKDVSFCFRPPAAETFKGGSIKFDQRDWENYIALGILGDSHYLETFGLQLIAGRNLSESDTVREFMVSEDMIRRLGLHDTSQVLGHRLVAGALDDHPGTIVGVVKNIHLHPLYNAIEPLLITTQQKDYAFVGIKINSLNAGHLTGKIGQIWKSIYPDNNYEYRFLDQQINDFYKGEDLLNKLIGSFAVVAIIISCLGLLGLISLLTVQRTKEIGIRKVIGASVANITLLLSKDFARLVGFALILATVIAWIAMSNWLQGFAYRISIPWWVFILAGTGNLSLALATICYHSVKAAITNPVESLRAE